MIVIISAIIFACGINKMHVSNFNLFISIVFISIAVLVGFVLKTSKQKNWLVKIKCYVQNNYLKDNLLKGF